jgi:hypothetical protein
MIKMRSPLPNGGGGKPACGRKATSTLFYVLSCYLLAFRYPSASIPMSVFRIFADPSSI